jgi:hypothetical protein
MKTNNIETMQAMFLEYRKRGGNFTRFLTSKETEISNWRYATQPEFEEALKIQEILADKYTESNKKLKYINKVYFSTLVTLALVYGLLMVGSFYQNPVLLIAGIIISLPSFIVFIPAFIVHARRTINTRRLSRDKRICDECIKSKQDYDRRRLVR